MFNFSELKQIHLEITNNCQASCPMCSRNHHGGIENPLIKITNWTLDQYKQIISPAVLNQIESIFFCGNFGDPLLNNDLLEMIEYTANTNPSVAVRIHTNGSLRNVSWWKKLAEVMPKDNYVIFALDGLEDTHSIYRIGTDYNQILKNAKAYINAGGQAEWAFIRFQHNAHQVDAARDIAKEIGFNSFVVKDSSRFLVDKQFPVLDKQGNVTNYLEPANESKIVFLVKSDIDNYRKIVDQSDIDCYALKNREVYIDAKGQLFPCCWIASIPYNYIEPNETMAVKQEILKQYHSLINDLGGVDQVDTNKHSIEDIINSNEYQTVWNKYWHGETKLISCVRACGVNKLSKPKDQFTDRDNFNE